MQITIYIRHIFCKLYVLIIYIKWPHGKACLLNFDCFTVHARLFKPKPHPLDRSSLPLRYKLLILSSPIHSPPCLFVLPSCLISSLHPCHLKDRIFCPRTVLLPVPSYQIQWGFWMGFWLDALCKVCF